MENYYIERLNSNKYTGKLFGIISIPPGTPFHFILANLAICFMIEILIGTYFISVIPAIIICYEMYRKNKMRIEILGNCIAEEIFFSEELEEYGVGEFIYDSPEITDEDRKNIFLDCLSPFTRKRITKNPQ
jgi:hypothetical protein